MLPTSSVNRQMPTASEGTLFTFLICDTEYGLKDEYGETTYFESASTSSTQERQAIMEGNPMVVTPSTMA